MKVHVNGYGTIKVKKPRLVTEEDFENFVSEIVGQTVKLVRAKPVSPDFHPVLGMGGYESHNSRRPS